MIKEENKKLEKILEEVIINNFSLKSLSGIKEEELESIYAVGYGIYQKSQFEKAEKVFSVLCNIDNYNHKYWMGLAACKKMLSKYDDAIKSYAIARVVNPEDADSSIQSSECYIKTNREEEASLCLDDAEALIEIYPNKNKKYENKIHNLRKYLSEKGKK